MRFKLRSLLIGIVYVAIGCTALASPSDIWATVIVTLTVATIVVAAIAGVFGRGENRAFLGGFALSGAAYLACIFAPGTADGIAPYLVTTKSLGWASRTLLGHDRYIPTVLFTPDGGRVVTSYPSANVNIWSVSPGPAMVGGNTATQAQLFFQIGHCLWALIVGCLGGIFAQWCSSKSSPGRSAAGR